jgi:calcineurin-like phosphoesterase family protein
MIFFTSDLHFCHANIIKYCNRPFSSVEEMNEGLITNWNSVVKQQDTVYIVGDVIFAKDISIAESIFKRLNGSKVLIAGNHDKHMLKQERFRALFQSVHQLLEIKIGTQDITLCHYAMVVWNKSHHSAWQLFGHSHGSMADDPHKLSIDVGVDCHNYTPISFDQIAEIMAKKQYKPVDHHE